MDFEMEYSQFCDSISDSIRTITLINTRKRMAELHGLWLRLAILIKHGVQEAAGSTPVTRTINKGSQMAKVSRL
jgi:hypothetical protein